VSGQRLPARPRVSLADTSWLARRFGTLPVYTASALGFTLASACRAAAPDVRTLIAARILQGLLAAPLVPRAMGMLLGGKCRARSISPAAGVMLFLAPALGPTAGGGLAGPVRAAPAAGRPASAAHSITVCAWLQLGASLVSSTVKQR
jgi:MFS family permease